MPSTRIGKALALAMGAALLSLSLAACSGGSAGSASSSGEPASSASEAAAPADAVELAIKEDSPFLGTWDYVSGFSEYDYAEGAVFMNLYADGTADFYYLGIDEDGKCTWKPTGDDACELSRNGDSVPMELDGKTLVMHAANGVGDVTFEKGEPRDVADHERVDFDDAVLAEDDAFRVELLNLYEEKVVQGGDGGKADARMGKFATLKLTSKLSSDCDVRVRDAYIDGDQVIAGRFDNGPKPGKSAQMRFLFDKQDGPDEVAPDKVTDLYGVEMELVATEQIPTDKPDTYAVGDERVYKLSFADAKGKEERR